jgi:pimeloyl-ACP methyl ester carboxylesterase
MPTPWRAVSTSVLDQLDDTALAVTDTGGSGQPVVCLDGSYANQAHWRHVVGTLGDGYRHITFDERARGKSRRSADYSFEGCIRDVDAVLEARDVTRPVLVGWSAGAGCSIACGGCCRSRRRWAWPLG